MAVYPGDQKADMMETQKMTATEAARTSLATKVAAAQPSTPIDEELSRLYDAASVGASLLGTLEEALHKVTNQQNLPPPMSGDTQEDMYRTPLGQAICSVSEKLEFNNDRLRSLIRAIDL